MNQEVVIAPQDDRKGRVFRAIQVARAEARIWEGSAADTLRPCMSMFCGSESELRAFGANLRLGRKITSATERRGKGEAQEFLRSARYKHAWQREPQGAVLTVFLPELFALDPGMVGERVDFVCLPSRAWVAEQRVDGITSIVRHSLRMPAQPGGYPVRARTFANVVDAETLRPLVPLALLFAAYLDRRIKVPILADPRFYVQLFLAALDEGVAVFPSESHYYGNRDEFGYRKKIGFVVPKNDFFARGVACSATHDEVENLLSAQTAAFFRYR